MERIRYIKLTALTLLVFCLSSCEGVKEQLIQSQSFQKREESQDSRVENAKSSIKICSQNLARLEKGKKNYSLKLKYLASLMSDNNCSVVALQEVVNKEVADKLAKELERQSKREYRAYLGKSRDRYITNGYLVAQDFGTVSYTHLTLPTKA